MERAQKTQKEKPELSFWFGHGLAIFGEQAILVDVKHGPSGRS
jgi:hypothetical protein